MRRRSSTEDPNLRLWLFWSSGQWLHRTDAVEDKIQYHRHYMELVKQTLDEHRAEGGAAGPRY